MSKRYFVNKHDGRKYTWSQHLANARLSYLELVTEPDPEPASEVEVVTVAKLDAITPNAPVSQLQRLVPVDES